MTDVFSKKKRSEVMSLIKSTNTKAEKNFRRVISSKLYPLGYRYRIHYRKLPGKPDVVFINKKVVVFMDGSFWHGYKSEKGKTKLSGKYWPAKIQMNMQRDKKVNKRLKKLGWEVVRVWEHDVKKDPEKIVIKILQALEQ